MDLIAHFQLQAEYNRWMNQSLLAVCDPLPDAMRRRDLGAFFRSVHGTFNHLPLVDRLWLARLEGRDFPVTALDQEVHADWEALKSDRAATDARVLDLVGGLEASDRPACCAIRAWSTAPSAGFAPSSLSPTCSSIRSIIAASSPRCSRSWESISARRTSSGCRALPPRADATGRGRTMSDTLRSARGASSRGDGPGAARATAYRQSEDATCPHLIKAEVRR